MKKEDLKNLTEEQIKELWEKEKTITIDKRKYRVERMSYGQWFLEPVDWKGGEKDRFSPETIFLRINKNKNLIEVIE